MVFSIIVVFETSLTEIIVTKETGYTCYGVKIVVLYQVNIYAGTLVCTESGDKHVSQSSVDYYQRTAANCLCSSLCFERNCL